MEQFFFNQKFLLGCLSSFITCLLSTFTCLVQSLSTFYSTCTTFYCQLQYFYLTLVSDYFLHLWMCVTHFQLFLTWKRSVLQCSWRSLKQGIFANCNAVSAFGKVSSTSFLFILTNTRTFPNCICCLDAHLEIP